MMTHFNYILVKSLTAICLALFFSLFGICPVKAWWTVFIVNLVSLIILTESEPSLHFSVQVDVTASIITISLIYEIFASFVFVL